LLFRFRIIAEGLLGEADKKAELCRLKKQKRSGALVSRIFGHDFPGIVIRPFR
jgi:hypothetical protein